MKAMYNDDRTQTTVTPAVVAISGPMLSCAIFTTATYYGCSWGIGCSYGSADTWLQLFSCFVPIAAIAQFLVLLAALADRRSLYRQRCAPVAVRWYPTVAAVGAFVALLAFTTSAAQWYVAYRAFGRTLSKKPAYGVVLIGHGAWAAVVSLLIGDTEQSRRVALGV